MNKEGIIKHKQVFDAWLNGVEIEIARGDGWYPIGTDPSFHSFRRYRVKTQTRTAWINIYSDYQPSSWWSREEADNFACDDRIACVPVTITYTEGEGLS